MIFHFEREFFMKIAELPDTFHRLLVVNLAFRDVLSPYIDRHATGIMGKDKDWLIVFARCVLRKDYETFSSILEMIQAERAGVALPLLRSIAEDLIYMLYFKSIGPEKANKFLYLLSVLEAYQTQANVLAICGEPGNDMTAKEILENLPKVRAEFREFVTNECGFVGVPKKNPVPKLRDVADKCKSLNLYMVCYHAVSKSVHFSPTNLGRLAFLDKDGRYTVSFDTFAHYHSTYLLQTVARLFGTLMPLLEEIIGLPTDQEVVKAQLAACEEFNKNPDAVVPLITNSELYGMVLRSKTP